MDFEISYTAEQEAFRREVRAWFDANVRPSESQKLPLDNNDLTREQWEFWREARAKVGAKGWLAPMFPKQYGGGGLTMEEAAIVIEESANADIRHMDDFGQNLCAPSLMVWG
ncbi:MAG: acyl-CoA dehydrogenase family protein, partial [Dehalococcoidia bacterium]|nr:acyl-CoA dehydrogenase family protein [Dehalococcoidia bacterium]